MCRRGHVRSDAPRVELLPDNIVFTNIRNIYIVCTVRQILVARTLLLVRRYREEQLLRAAFAPVAGSSLLSSAAVEFWFTNLELALRFGIDLSN